MKNRIDFDSAHRRVWEAIPWLLNGTANPAQRQLVEAHLPGCADCREELARQTELQASMSHEGAAIADPEPGLRRLFERIDQAADIRATAQPRGSRSGWGGGAGWLVYGLTFAVIVEAVAISVLGLSVLGSGGSSRSASQAPGAYQTLSDAPASGAAATIRIVPAPEMSLGDLRQLLHGLDLQIVAGPNGSGAYALGPQGASAPARTIDRQTVDRQIARLRLSGMRLVEPIADARSAPGTPP